MNTFEVALSDAGGGKVKCALPGGKSIALDAVSGSVTSGKAVFGIRPEHMDLAPDGELGGKITLSEKLGSETMVHVDIGAGVPIIVKADGLTGVKMGDSCSIKLNPAACHLFTSDGALIRNGSLL
jgi:multiple sugar transport system ATP-binding protein